MKTFLDCIPCQMRQSLQAVRQISDDDVLAEQVLRASLKLAAEVDYDQPPAVIGRQIHALIRELTNNPDPYKSIKEKANSNALRAVPIAKKKIEKAVDPFEAGLRFAIAGNILDFALYGGWDDQRFQSSLDDALTKKINQQEVANLQQLINDAENILYLADNAGESVFDRLFIEQFHHSQITYAVKGYPVINDALYEDAVIAGLDKFARIVDNGTDAAGTVLSLCSKEFLEEFEKADLVIAKGQANYETLCDAPRLVYFLTQIKCPTIARDLQGEVGDWVITTSHAEQAKNQ